MRFLLKATRHILFFTVIGAFQVSVGSLAAEITDMTVQFADPVWDGKMIPEGEHCKKFGGNGSTPPLTVSNIPDGANAIIVEFSDVSYRPMASGGHGIVGWRIGNSNEVFLRPIPGGEDELPQGTWLERKNRATGAWRSPGYLPPCSGGQLNKYVATIKAVRMNGNDIAEELAEVDIVMGKY